MPRMSATEAQKLADRMSPEDRKALGIKTDSEIIAKNEAKLEKGLQNQCESWLSCRGYRRLTADLIKNDPPERGYFGHIVNARRNPLLLDIFILDPHGRYLMVELKNGKGASFQPGQKELIEQGYGQLATNFTEFESIVKEWEQPTQENDDE